MLGAKLLEHPVLSWISIESSKPGGFNEVVVYNADSKFCSLNIPHDAAGRDTFSDGKACALTLHASRPFTESIIDKVTSEWQASTDFRAARLDSEKSSLELRAAINKAIQEPMYIALKKFCEGAGITLQSTPLYMRGFRWGKWKI